MAPKRQVALVQIHRRVRHDTAKMNVHWQVGHGLASVHVHRQFGYFLSSIHIHRQVGHSPMYSAVRLDGHSPCTLTGWSQSSWSPCTQLGPFWLVGASLAGVHVHKQVPITGWSQSIWGPCSQTGPFWQVSHSLCTLIGWSQPMNNDRLVAV